MLALMKVMLSVLILAAAAPARAQEVAMLVEEKAVLAAEKAEITKELPSLETKMATLGTLVRGDEQTMRDLEQQFGQKKRVHDSVQQDYANRVEQWNRDCSGRMLYGAEYQSCKTQQEQLMAFKHQNEPKLRQMEAEAEQMKARYAQLQNQHRQHQNDLTLAQARSQKLRNYLSQLDVRLRALDNAIRTSCPAASGGASDEEIKLKCGNVQFDRARGNLPPCETDKCLEWERRYRRN